MTGRGHAVALALCLALAGPTLAETPVPRAHLAETHVDFGTVKTGAMLQHTILLRNLGSADLVIQDMRFSVPALTIRGPRVIPPGAEAALLLELDTAGLRDEVRAHVVLATNDPHAARLELQVQGRVESLVDLLPRPAIFVSAFRWEVEDKESAIALANRGESPLEILSMRLDGDRFTARLKAIEPGRRYELAVKLRESGPAGMGLGRITVHTNQGETIAIPVFTLLRDKIYVNPTEVDLGRITRGQIERHPESARDRTETLYVYKYRGEGFRIQIDSGPAFITIDKIPSEGPAAMVNIPRQGPTAVFELRVAPIPAKLQSGPLEGTIRISTNDPEVPEIRVPVHGVLD
jgi:hypothetical protein